MASIQELAVLSNLVYQDDGGIGLPDFPAGWDVFRNSANDVGLGAASGYYGIAYINRRTDEIVIAHRGTQFAGKK
jgi:hypothetical protein